MKGLFYGTSISTKNNPDFGQLISIMAVNWFAVLFDRSYIKGGISLSLCHTDQLLSHMYTHLLGMMDKV